jgi:hypothetical protein
MKASVENFGDHPLEQFGIYVFRFWNPVDGRKAQRQARMWVD